MVDRILSTFAVPSLNAEKVFQLTDRVNVMSAELIIIYLALEWLLDLCSGNFVTLSDVFLDLQAMQASGFGNQVSV